MHPPRPHPTLKDNMPHRPETQVDILLFDWNNVRSETLHDQLLGAAGSVKIAYISGMS